jgi:hypothetical protein
MKGWKTIIFCGPVVVMIAATYIALLVRRGFSANTEPSTLEKILAQTVRNLAIPNSAFENRRRAERREGPLTHGLRQ